MNEDDNKLLAIYQRIDQAMVAKDTEILEEILDENYVLIHMSGFPQRKQDWLNQIENEQMRYFQTMPQKTFISLDGNTATVRCNTKLDARIYGIRRIWSMILEMQFKKHDDNWYPVKAIATSN